MSSKRKIETSPNSLQNGKVNLTLKVAKTGDNNFIAKFTNPPRKVWVPNTQDTRKRNPALRNTKNGITEIKKHPKPNKPVSTKNGGIPTDKPSPHKQFPESQRQTQTSKTEVDTDFGAEKESMQQGSQATKDDTLLTNQAQISDTSPRNDNDDVYSSVMQHKMATLNSEDRTSKSEPSIYSSKSSCKNANTKQPPIYIKNCSAQELLNKFKTENLKIQFTIKNTAKGNCMLISDDSTSYTTTVNSLVKLSIEFFTFIQKENKPKSILLTGLHENTEFVDVHNNLVKRNLNNVELIKVDLFKGKPRNGRTFLIQCTADSDLRAVTNIKHMEHQIVPWEPL
ncbi:hypothetical protein TKK_0010034 [Trichogramma kaykai]